MLLSMHCWSDGTHFVVVLECFGAIYSCCMACHKEEFMTSCGDQGVPYRSISLRFRSGRYRTCFLEVFHKVLIVLILLQL